MTAQDVRNVMRDRGGRDGCAAPAAAMRRSSRPLDWFMMISRFIEFSLHWQIYGSYPDRDYPFGLPEHITVLATEKAATACRVFAESKGSQNIDWHVKWKNIDLKLVDSCRQLIDDIDAYKNIIALTEQDTTGTYLISWLIYGFNKGRQFKVALDFFAPESNLNDLGKKFWSVMNEIRKDVE